MPALNVRVGFSGLGVMGTPMAHRVMAAGYPLQVLTRSPAKAKEFAGRGADIAPDSRTLAAASDVVVVMVPDTADLEEVVAGSDGLIAGAHAGLVVIAMGTYDPAAMPPLAALLRKANAWFLDAPVSGGDVAATSGELSIMVGGEVAGFDLAKPVLETMGKQVTHIGPSGAGQTAKACNQLIVGATIQAVAEALSLAQAAGLDGARVRDALMGGFASSRVLELHGRRMLDSDFRPGARAALHAKDARIVMATASRFGVRLAGFEPVAAAFERLVNEGYGDDDHAALIKLVRQSERGPIKEPGHDDNRSVG